MGISNPFQMVVAIIFIVSVASIVRARIGLHRDFEDRPRRRRRDRYAALPDAENEALRTEIKALKDRVAVLERLATDSHSTLEREFEKLRQQD